MNPEIVFKAAVCLRQRVGTERAAGSVGEAESQNILVCLELLRLRLHVFVWRGDRVRLCLSVQ